MNIELLKTNAAQLKQLLQLQAPTLPRASGMLQDLTPILDAAIAGQITTPYSISDVPYSYPFSNGDIHDIPDIEEAFARFANAVTGFNPSDYF